MSTHDRRRALMLDSAKDAPYASERPPSPGPRADGLYGRLRPLEYRTPAAGEIFWEAAWGLCLKATEAIAESHWIMVREETDGPERSGKMAKITRTDGTPLAKCAVPACENKANGPRGVCLSCYAHRGEARVAQYLAPGRGGGPRRGPREAAMTLRGLSAEDLELLLGARRRRVIEAAGALAKLGGGKGTVPGDAKIDEAIAELHKATTEHQHLTMLARSRAVEA